MKQLTSLRLSDLWKEVKTEEEFWGELKPEVRQYLKMLMEGILVEEQARSLAAPRYKRKLGRLDWRNGFYTRNIESCMGLIENIRVPRNRLKGIEFSIFKKYRRKEVALIDLIKDAFLAGLSTRKVGQVLEVVLGYKISAQSVSNISKSLDSAVAAFHTKALEDSYKYLFLDGITLKVKTLAGAVKKTVLVACGITTSGIKEIISFRLTPGESEDAWYAFMDSLYRRGLYGKNLELIIFDGSASLRRAADIVYPYNPKQRCWVHKLANVAAKLPKKDTKKVMGSAKKIYLADSRKDAETAFKNWVRNWQDKYPKAVGCLAKDIEDMLTFFYFDKDIRSKIRTTNLIERSFREIRRRVRPMACFQNSASINRIIFGVISGINKGWKSKPIKEIKKFTQNT
ncbi:MAG: IS256 family transposase [Actinobacteria bacterium]|nr:IS256 family transposase [Actinomycetota bacterium]